MKKVFCIFSALMAFCHSDDEVENTTGAGALDSVAAAASASVMPALPSCDNPEDWFAVFSIRHHHGACGMLHLDSGRSFKIMYRGKMDDDWYELTEINKHLPVTSADDSKEYIRLNSLSFPKIHFPALAELAEQVQFNLRYPIKTLAEILTDIRLNERNKLIVAALYHYFLS